MPGHRIAALALLLVATASCGDAAMDDLTARLPSTTSGTPTTTTTPPPASPITDDIDDAVREVEALLGGLAGELGAIDGDLAADEAAQRSG